MKKVVKIQGLDCANCAKFLEGEINKIQGVENAKIEFVKQKLEFESDNIDKSIEDIISLTRKVEPDVKILYKIDKNTSKFSKQLFFNILMLVLGVAIGCCALFISLPIWAFWILFVASALCLGYKTYYKAITQLFRGVVNENMLLTISVVGASIIGEYMEGLMVIALYSIGKIFEGLAVDNSRKSIAKLVELQPEYAVVLRNDQEVKCNPSEVNVGEILFIKPGEKVALDGVIIEGSSSINTQSLTGESVPITLKEGDEILSGSIVIDGILKVKVSKVYNESTVSKIMNLIENASANKSKTETTISKLTKWYTLGVVIVALAVWGIVWAVTKNFDLALYRGLIFLVVSCPCAFAISVPLSYFSGLGNASKNGVLIKGSNYLDLLTKLNVVAFDKTGTLTTGEFVIEKIVVKDEKRSEQEILYLAGLGEQYSLHPLAKSIVKACGELKDVDFVSEKAGEGVEFNYNNKKYFVGSRNKELKNTTVEVYENNKVIGEIYLKDCIKNTSKQTCEGLKVLGLSTILLSGDKEESVKLTANEIGIDKSYAKLLPQDKYEYLKRLKQEKKIIGYVGDGINDAPSLMLADIGISMGINGSPASIEASDVVLVDDNPIKVVKAIKISKFTKTIVWQNIILSALVKLVFLVLGAVGVTGMLWAVFADVGVTLLAILNSMRALKYNPNKQKCHKKQCNL